MDVAGIEERPLQREREGREARSPALLHEPAPLRARFVPERPAATSRFRATVKRATEPREGFVLSGRQSTGIDSLARHLASELPIT
jgi:hypothetical protein